jgi:predicted nuclease of predicted toxin-antitoxin system
MPVTVGTVVGLVASGHSNTEILKAYPYLEEEDIRQPFAYAAWCVEELDIPLSARMRILVDMNLSPFEAVHWSHPGLPSASDTDIMDHASAGGFVIRTQDVVPAAVGGLVVNALNAVCSHLTAGVLVTVDGIHHRIRLLPI